MALTEKENGIYLRDLFRSVSLCLILFLVLLKFLFHHDKTGIQKKKIPKLEINDLMLTLWSTRVVQKTGQKIRNVNAVLFQSLCGAAHVFRNEGLCYLIYRVKPVLLLHKAETVEPILSSNRHLRKGVEIHFAKRMFKDGILNSPLEKWRPTRKLLTPAFHFRKLDEYVLPLNGKAASLNQKIMVSIRQNQLVDISQLLQICCLEISCELLMGFEVQEENILAFEHFLKEFRVSVFDRVFQPLYWLDSVYFRTKKGKYIEHCVRSAEEFTKKIVLERKRLKFSQTEQHINGGNIHEKGSSQVSTKEQSTEKKKLGVLDILLNQHFQDKTFNMEFITNQVDNFMIAGSDTVACNVSFAVYMLGLYPDIQRKVHEELDRLFRDDMERPITREDIQKMKYLECVMKETRRLFPPVPLIGRTLDEDTIINGYKVSKGTSCLINIYMLHRDPVVFPNPEVFDPERFWDPPKRHPYAFVPFSAGPRNCIGQKLAVLETSILVVSILRSFEVRSMVPFEKLLLNDEIILCSEHGLPMTFLSRSKISVG